MPRVAPGSAAAGIRTRDRLIANAAAKPLGHRVVNMVDETSSKIHIILCV